MPKRKKSSSDEDDAEDRAPPPPQPRPPPNNRFDCFNVRPPAAKAPPVARAAPAPPGPPGAPGIEVHVWPPTTAEAGPGAPAEPHAPWSIAQVRQFKERGVTRGNPPSPVLPRPLIKASTEDPLGKYEILRPAGSGTYATVKIVAKKSTRVQYALKAIANVDTDKKLLQAYRECTIMNTLSHGNICRLYNAEIHAGKTVYLLLEPCITDLHTYIQKCLRKMHGMDKLGEVKHIALALLNAVTYMHGELCLHRDLKTNNILLKADGGVKITDFGLARKIEDKIGGRTRKYSQRRGTYNTMAPEILFGNTDYGFETDLWSLACVIGEMFAGAPLFPPQENNLITMLNAITDFCGDICWPADSDPALTTGNVRRVRPFFQDHAEGDPDVVDMMDRAFNLSHRMTLTQWMAEPFFSNHNPDSIKSMRDISNYPFLGEGFTWHN